MPRSAARSRKRIWSSGRRRKADQRPGNHPLALEREHQGAQYSTARPLSRAAFLGDLAAHAGKESAVGREAARTQRRGNVAHVRRVARRCTEADIHAIKRSMEKRPDARAAFLDSRTAVSAVNTGPNRVTQIVIRPLKSPEFRNSFAVGKDLSDSSLRNASKIKWRRGWDSNPRRRK